MSDCIPLFGCLPIAEAVASDRIYHHLAAFDISKGSKQRIEASISELWWQVFNKNIASVLLQGGVVLIVLVVWIVTHSRVNNKVIKYNSCVVTLVTKNQ